MKTEVNINGPWELYVYSDADYAGESNTRKILTGYIIIINGFLIGWSSRSQKKVTLSVTEV